MTFEAPNINALWAALLVEELVRNDVTFFCLAPGSRSTPLVRAVAKHAGARHVMHFDERGTAFCALGYARASGRPAAWITTSGTAVANGFPAVVEAAMEGVPLLLITADRPPELRDTGANQTIDQVKIFGGYVRWQVDLPVPDSAIDPAMVLTTVDQAVHQARRAPGGPVHLNCMFREPLAPVEKQEQRGADLRALAAWRAQEAPYTQYALPANHVAPAEVDALAAQLQEVERGLLAVGRLDTATEGTLALQLAERLGWPLLPDVTSQLRLGNGEARSVVSFYDQILASDSFRREHVPQAVLQLGGRSVSKRLGQFLGHTRPLLYARVGADPRRHDPNHQVTLHLEGHVGTFCEALIDALRTPTAASTAWQESWKAASDVVDQAIAAGLDEPSALTEPGVARLVSRHLHPAHGLFLANSMPVRDMDMYAVSDGNIVRVAANRGASGIDGNVATAVGYARGLGQPVTLVIGDLALLHDLNSLALIRQCSFPMVIIAVNNQGGGIFSFLPIARFEDVFEPFFGTPHPFEFAAAAQLFGLAYHRPRTEADFVTAYRESIANATPAIIEVETDREDNYALHRALERSVVEALTRASRRLRPI